MHLRHILVIITQGEQGGAQQFVRTLTTHADPERFRFTVAWGGTHGDFLATSLPSTVKQLHLRNLGRTDIAPWRDLKAIGEIRSTIEAVRPDVVLLISSKAGFIGSLAAKSLRTKLPNLRVIYRIGGWTFNDPWPAWKKFLYQSLEKYSAPWKDIIVVNNRHDLEQAKKLKITPKERLVCIPNGIDPYLPLMSQSDARAELDGRVLQQRPYKFLVGTIANFYPAKDLATLINAAARMNDDVRFVVIGNGPLKKDLESQIARQGLRGRVFLVGSINDASRLLPAFDAFVLTSNKEGFPWAVLEAMAARIPVVATRVGAIPEMLTDGVSGLVCEPGDAAGIAKAIGRLRDNEHVRQELAIAAHQRVMTSFTLRSMVSAFEQLFIELS